MTKWSLYIFLFYISTFLFIFISPKNLQYYKYSNSLKEESNTTCPENCKDGLCNNETKKCDSCIDGYYSDDCTETCPTKNCQKCNQDSSDCEQCKNNLKLIDNYCCEQYCNKCNDDGCLECSDKTKYGLTCENCPDNCFYNEKGSDRKCYQDSGNCFSCISGKTGIKCDKDCSKGCDLTKANCDMNDGTCQCQEKYYGTKCEYNCDEHCEKCDSSTGVCEKCESGFYPDGIKCISCPQNCQGECPQGKCISCKDGFYGDTCDKSCPEFCINKACDKDDGKCDCQYHFTRDSYCTECENHFDKDTNCQNCSKNYNISTECNYCINKYNSSNNCETCLYNYDINSECINCLYHFDKNTDCQNCLENYDISTKCQSCINFFDYDTNCIECKKGYYGEKCDMACFKGCDTTEENCNRKDAKCKKCKFPYYGEKCEYESNKKNCIEIDKETGNCLKCEETYYLINNDCESCSSNCSESKCEDGTGNCYSCASNNTYGDKCEYSCSEFCKKITGGPICYRINGSCVEGCITSGNFSDDKCTECTDGYYNRTGGCTELCPENCDGICDKDNGFCHGCKSGFYKDKCDERCNQTLCKSDCQQTSGKCNECNNPYYQNISDDQGCTRCPNNCTKCSYILNIIKCTECEIGKYGNTCEEDCSSNCKEQCNIDGNCVCKEEYYGDKCSQECKGCDFQGCRDDTGECFHHFCSDRFYDPRTCNSTCSENCGNEGTCDLFTGECSICNGNKWGTNCEKNCSEGCDSDGRVDCCYVKETKVGKGINIDFIENKNNKNSLTEDQDDFYLFNINLGGYDLKILADFESNSPLVIFDNSTEMKKIETEIYNISIDDTYNSSNSTYYIEESSGNNELYAYDGFTLNKEKLAKDRLILNNQIFDNFSFLICQEFKLEKDFDLNKNISGIVGLGLRSYFSEYLFYSNTTNKFPKNILIKSIDDDKKKSIYIGDYNDDIKKFFSKLSTMQINNKNDILTNKLITYKTSFRGIAYSLRKAYRYDYDKDVILSNRIETTIVFNNLYRQFFEKIYFGDLFDNGCYFRSLQGGEVEYYCDINKKQAIQALPKLGLIMGDYIYYLSYQFLFKESGRFITFIIKFHGQSQQRIELGKSFFDEFSVVYNNGNQTLNFFGETKKLNVLLKDTSNLLNIDSDIFTPGGWVTIIVFATALFIIFCYLSKYCWKKKSDDENEEEEEDEEDDELLIDDTLE